MIFRCSCYVSSKHYLDFHLHAFFLHKAPTTRYIPSAVAAASSSSSTGESPGCQVNVTAFSSSLVYIGSGKMPFAHPDSPEAHRLWQEAEKLIKNKWWSPVKSDWMQSLLLACKLCHPEDEVVAIDCRSFHDPQRDHGRKPPAQNHVGYHHTVLAGLQRGGAKVWDSTRKKEFEISLAEWWRECVAAPLWNSAMKVAAKMRSQQASATQAVVVPKLVVVFVCKYGRHRSVALQRCFIQAIADVPWANLSDSSHLASHSWRFATCNLCQDSRCIFLSSVTNMFALMCVFCSRICFATAVGGATAAALCDNVNIHYFIGNRHARIQSPTAILCKRFKFAVTLSRF